MRTDATYKRCGECGKANGVEVESTWTCDHCGEVIPEGEGLQSVVFSHKAGDTAYRDLDFCSWACCLKRLRTEQTDYFINPPVLHFDREGKSSAQAFFEAIKEAN